MTDQGKPDPHDHPHDHDPDPDEVRPAGRFRVYLGAAAGVGKTCARLDEGWRRFQRGADVAVGYVETHKRPFTIEQLRDFPMVPRKRVEYRGSTWEEMDLAAVLERHPEVVLIDELAHTNGPGSGPQNLVALRELSLRFVADETEEELIEFLRSRGPSASNEVWDTAERILVAVTGAPGNDTVIRRAARMAARMKGDLLVVHVVPSDAPGKVGATDRLEELVHDVGGSWQVVHGEDVAATIMATANANQIT